MKYNYFYKITNKVNGHFYYGIHSTNNLDDGYMGSGHLIKLAIKKYGEENFEKEILKFFDSRKEAANYEAEVVTFSLIKEENCYNIIPGGEVFPHLGFVAVFDKENNIKTVVTQKEYHTNRERYCTPYAPVVKVKNKETREYEIITTEEYHNNKEKYEHLFANKVLVTDSEGKSFFTDKNDERFLTGDIKLYWKGRKRQEKSIKRQKETFKKINHQQGEKNSQYGTCWIHNEKEAKKVKKDTVEEYLLEGWKLGRVDKIIKEKKIPQYKTIDETKAYALHDTGLSWIKVGEKLGVTKGVIEKFLRWKRYG